MKANASPKPINVAWARIVLPMAITARCVAAAGSVTPCARK